jgi:carboxyl-terminal processing protease
MMRPADPAGHHLPWRRRAVIAIGLMAVMLVLAAAAPVAVLAPRIESAIEGVTADSAAAPVQAPLTAAAPLQTSASSAASTGPGVSGQAPPRASSGSGINQPAPPIANPVAAPASQVVASASNVDAGINLITAVFNSIEDRFFRPLDSRDLLGAAWEGATRGLTQQKRPPGSVDAPTLTGDRASDLAAFIAQYRALIAGAGPDVDANAIAMAAADTMTESVGEQHTVFLTPDIFARFRNSLTSDEGQVGIGILIQGQAAPFVIAQVVPGAPASTAGVQDGDQIQAINGKDVSQLDLRGVSDLLRGDEGQPVTLTLGRGASAAQAPAPAQLPASASSASGTVDVTVVRGRFSLPPLTMRVLPEGVCYLHLTTFPVSFVVGPTGRTIGQDLDYNLNLCEQAGVKGWIMDLRGDGGGASLAEVLGRFLDAGPILVEKDRDHNRFEQATDGHIFPVQHPLVVLIDGNSASASEAFAAAIQEYKRGVVMGQRSAGALNTGNIIPLPLSAGMMVAIREVFTGVKEIAVDQVGVTPDVTLPPSRDTSSVPAEAVKAALNPPAGVGPTPPGPSPTDGLLPTDELKRRVEPVLFQAGDAADAQNQILRGDLALDTYQYYASDYPSLTAARERAVRLGWLGTYARWMGAGFPPPFAVTVSIYKDGDGAHKDLQEIYEPGEPHNPPQWKATTSPVNLGDETLAQIGVGQNEGRIWISWRRNSVTYTVARNVPPGEPQTFDEIARLAQIVDQRAQQHAP